MGYHDKTANQISGLQSDHGHVENAGRKSLEGTASPLMKGHCPWMSEYKCFFSLSTFLYGLYFHNAPELFLYLKIQNQL